MASLDELNRLQIEEMDKYKWIVSEKCGYDVGSAAKIDWVKKYAKSFREWFENTFGPIKPPKR